VTFRGTIRYMMERKEEGRCHDTGSEYRRLLHLPYYVVERWLHRAYIFRVLNFAPPSPVVVRCSRKVALCIYR